MIIPKTYKEIGLLTYCNQLRSLFYMDQAQFEELFEGFRSGEFQSITGSKDLDAWKTLNCYKNGNVVRTINVRPKTETQNYNSLDLFMNGIRTVYSEYYYEQRRLAAERARAEAARRAAMSSSRSYDNDSGGFSRGSNNNHNNNKNNPNNNNNNNTK